MSTFFVRFIALCVRFSTFLKKVQKFFRLFSPPLPSVHKLIEQTSCNAERFILHISNDRFWSKSQGVGASKIENILLRKCTSDITAGRAMLYRVTRRLKNFC